MVKHAHVIHERTLIVLLMVHKREHRLSYEIYILKPWGFLLRVVSSSLGCCCYYCCYFFERLCTIIWING